MTNRTVRAAAPRIATDASGRALKLGPARSDQHFTMLEPFEADRVWRACDFFLKSKQDVRHASERPRKEVRLAIAKLRDVETARAFKDALDETFESIAKWNHRPQHALELAVRLWEEGCIVLPKGLLIPGTDHVFKETLKRDRAFKCLPSLRGDAGALIERVRAHAHETEAWPEPRRVVAALFWALVTTQGLARGATLSWTEARELYGIGRDDTNSWRLKHALDALLPPVDDAVGQAPDGRAPNVRGGGEGSRSDPEFRWVLAVDPAMDAWRRLCAQWIRIQETRQAQAQLTTANLVLQVLSSLPADCRDPYVLLDPRHAIHGAVVEGMKKRLKGGYLTASLKRARALFAQALLELEAAPDRRLRPTTALENPVAPSQIPRPPARQRKTSKEPIPTEWVEMMARILTDDDYAWPRTRQSDYFLDTDGRTRIWSPVRACMILALLSYQGRFSTFAMADSGEGDPSLPRYHDEPHPEWDDGRPGWVEWVNNDLPVERHKRERGIIRRIEAAPGARFHFEANKGGKEYASHWRNRPLYRILTELRDWQVANNPVRAPTPYDRVPSGKTATKIGREANSARYYLFRDPTNTADPTLPVSRSRVRRFFIALLDELETRLRAQGCDLPDGSRLRLVRSRTRSGLAKSVMFTVHTTRVTVITHLMAARVPLAVVRSDTGHWSHATTSYYDKSGYAPRQAGPGEPAEAGGRPGAAAHFLASLAGSETARDVQLESAGRGPANPGPPASARPWRLFEYGACPNGATRCAEAGHASPDAGGEGAPCLRCVHLLSGPGFASGMIRRHRAACEAASTAERTKRELTAEMDSIEELPLPVPADRLRKVEADLAAAGARYEAAIDELASLSCHLEASMRPLVDAGPGPGHGPTFVAVHAGAEPSVAMPPHGAATVAGPGGEAVRVVRADADPASPRMQLAAMLVALGKSDDAEAAPARAPAASASVRLAMRSASAELERWAAAKHANRAGVWAPDGNPGTAAGSGERPMGTPRRPVSGGTRPQAPGAGSRDLASEAS